VKNNSTQRTQLRNTLLHNGYNPLPLLDKGIRIKGWSTADIDADWLAKFERVSKYANTGIRCDGLVAFDIDVYDEELADECERIITRRVGRTNLCRVGQWPKRLLLYRLGGESMRSMRTGKFSGHMVEVLTSRKRQFAAFGIHPGTGSSYEWLDDYTPENTPYGDLPEVTAESAHKALEDVTEFFEQRLLILEAPGGMRRDLADEEHDLTDDFQIGLHNNGISMSWGKLKESLDEKGVWGNIIREDGSFGDSSAVHFYKANGSGRLMAYDFARDTAHYEPVVEGQLDDLEPPEGPGLFEKPLEGLLSDYVLIADGTVRMIDRPEYKWEYSKFRLKNSNLMIPIQMKKDTKMAEAVEIWKKHPDTVRADVVELRPDEPDRAIVREGNLSIFNTYNPPLHIDTNGEAVTCLEFIHHLVPDPDDRKIFLDWHATKVAHPEYRMHGLVMTTPTFGTGRGTWMDILKRLFGHQYVNQVELGQLVGRGGQAEFNDFLADSLIVEVPEALEEREDRTRYQVKHIAYERMKTVCDTRVAKVHIKRKYGQNAFQHVYASLLICSNHADAFAIPEGDRRLIVIRNTEQRLTQAPDQLQARIYEWMDRPENISALHAWMLDLALKSHYDPFGDPPLTPAKQSMIDASTSDMDVIWKDFVDQCKGDLCTPQQWRSFANITRFNDNLDVPQNFEGAIIKLLSEHGRRISALGKKTIKIDGVNYRVWIVKNFDHWERRSGRTLASEARAEILLNGPPEGEDTNISSLF
jgi:hypothetical protein